MRKLAVASVASLAIAGLGVAPAMADDAATTTKNASSAERGSRCVTKSEFRKVKRGMKMKRVHRIFDTRGKQSYFYTIGGDRYTGREYKACHHPKWSLVSVDFKNGRETGKFAYWG